MGVRPARMRRRGVRRGLTAGRGRGGGAVVAAGQRQIPAARARPRAHPSLGHMCSPALEYSRSGSSRDTHTAARALGRSRRPNICLPVHSSCAQGGGGAARAHFVPRPGPARRAQAPMQRQCCAASGPAPKGASRPLSPPPRTRLRLEDGGRREVHLVARVARKRGELRHLRACVCVCGGGRCAWVEGGAWGALARRSAVHQGWQTCHTQNRARLRAAEEAVLGCEVEGRGQEVLRRRDERLAALGRAQVARRRHERERLGARLLRLRCARGGALSA